MLTDWDLDIILSPLATALGDMTLTHFPPGEGGRVLDVIFDATLSFVWKQLAGPATFVAPDLTLTCSLDNPELWDPPSGDPTDFGFLGDMVFSWPNGV